MDAALKRLQRTVPNICVNLAKEIQDNADLMAGDPRRLEELLFHLLHNSWKFRSLEEKCHIYVQATRHDGLNTITFKDTGIGIPQEYKEQVFEPFFQAPQMAERYGGLGLGLAIAKRIVELHKGSSLECDTSSEQVACFIIKLPLMQQNTE